jgi:hypothetical protein
LVPHIVSTVDGSDQNIYGRNAQGHVCDKLSIYHREIIPSLSGKVLGEAEKRRGG